jgi:fumarate hydratase class I
MTNTLDYPFTEKKVRRLRIGDQVLISGLVFTARDRIHRHLFLGGDSPVRLENGALYHCGPSVVRENGSWHILAAGPTTSIREEPYMPAIIRRYKPRLIIGKGGMGRATAGACADIGCAYLQAVGGAAQVLQRHIEEVGDVHFLREFGPSEAMWSLTVRDFPALVTMDSTGKSLHERVSRASARARRRLLKEKPAFEG